MWEGRASLMKSTMFVDLENVSVDAENLQTLAQDYGDTSIRIYHPKPDVRTWDQARAIGAQVINSPPSPTGKSSTDMVLATDMIEEAIWERPEWIVLLSGDVDFLPALSLIKNKTECKIAVHSMPIALSDRLKAAYESVVDKIMLLHPESGADPNLAQGIVRMILTDKPSKGFWTGRLVINKLIDRGPYMVNGESHIKRVLDSLRDEGVLFNQLEMRMINGESQERRILYLNRDHPFVKEVMKEAPLSQRRP
jgi:hypothetical protein